MNSGLFEHIRTFARVVETGSFTAVAEEQHQSQPTVSRQIGALEDHLGVRLLQRTTRALNLTEEGRAYYAHALTLIDGAEQAAQAVRPGGAQVSGMLRIAAPLAFARLHILPQLKPFLTAHPDIRTDWILGDRPIDLVEEGIDAAIRIGELRDTTLIARRIGMTRRRVLATPNFLAEHGVPEHPEDLTSMDCIVYTGLATQNRWRFADRSGASIEVSVSGRVTVSASEGMRSAVLEGLGIAVCPTWLFSGEVERGDLVACLEDFEPAAMPIHAVMPSRRMVTPRVRAFVEYLAQQFKRDPRFRDA